MASVAIMKSYDQIGRKEDVADIITNISPTLTPFQTMIGSESIHNIIHSWQEDSLIAAGVNAQVEGATAPSAVQNPTVLRTGTTQILSKTANVSGTADVVKTYGRDKELAYQLMLRSKELKRDFEYALVGVNQAQVTGTDATARQFASYLAQLDTSTTDGLSAYYYMGATNGYNSGPLGGTSGSAATISETSVTTVAEQLYANGVEASTLMVKPTDALNIAQWQANLGTNSRTRFVDNGDRDIVNVVDVYVSAYGRLKVVMNRFSLTTAAFVFDPAFWKKLVLRNWFRQTLAKTGDSEQVQILGEFGLKHKNYAASGAIVNIL